LLMVPTVVLWFVGLLGGTVALVAFPWGQHSDGRDRTRRQAMAGTAVVLGLIPPAVVLGFVSVAAGTVLLLILSWRRSSPARTGFEKAVQNNAGEIEVDKRVPGRASAESGSAEPKPGLARVGPLTVVALAIAILIPLALVVITKNAPGGQLNYEILLVGPAYFLCLGCEAALLFLATHLDRDSGRASLPVALVVVILASLALFGFCFMW